MAPHKFVAIVSHKSHYLVASEVRGKIVSHEYHDQVARDVCGNCQSRISLYPVASIVSH